MSLLKMINESKSSADVVIHVGVGMQYIPNNILSVLVDYYNDTGINLIDAYKNTITWNSDEYVNYMIQGKEHELIDTSEIASSVNKIRRLKIFESEAIRKALLNIERYNKGLVKKEVTKRDNKRKKASKYIQNKSIRNEVFSRYGKICLSCGATKHLTIDHVIPISRGGKNEIDNLQPLCKSCNSSKGTKKTDYRN